VVACGACLASAAVLSSRAEETSSEAQGGDFSRFSHTTPEHARQACLLCHRREDGAARPVLPGHAPCAGCHAQQFNDRASAICTICHTDTGSGALKGFPRLKTFNMVFDHARHNTAGARPRGACAACHRPERRGVALSIPAGFGAHATCFQCHAARAQAGGRDISSCGTCHRVGSYARTPETAQAYRVNFSHAKHDAGEKLSCQSCHQVRAGAPQRRQVTAPVPQEHNRSQRAQSCLTCHDGKRAFGGYDFASCKRCHTGRTFGF
jgi:c(7)-type cytochrome triheme protein